MNLEQIIKRKGWAVYQPFFPVQNFGTDGIRTVHARATTREIREQKDQWQAFASDINPAPAAKASSKGIVICAGGICYLTCAWVNIRILRQHGCQLPIEVWHFEHELTGEMQEELKSLNVECRNLSHLNHGKIRSFQSKPFAILHSRFDEVLYLDADNTCARDPSYLFQDPRYLESGAMFWPDYWRTDKQNPIWKVTGTTDYEGYEQESGQLIIDKRKCWRALNLCCYFNQKSAFYYKFLNGDKDTFKFAWMALKTPFFMVKHAVGQCGYLTDDKRFIGTTMVQHDSEGHILFLHRNLLKWDATFNAERVWHEIRTFKPEANNRSYHLQGNTMSIEGDINQISFDSLFAGLEESCLDFLEELRKRPVYLDFFLYYYIAFFRGKVPRPATSAV